MLLKTEIETDHIEGYCEQMLAFGLKKDLIEQIVATLPPSISNY